MCRFRHTEFDVTNKKRRGKLFWYHGGRFESHEKTSASVCRRLTHSAPALLLAPFPVKQIQSCSKIPFQVKRIEIMKFLRLFPSVCLSDVEVGAGI